MEQSPTHELRQVIAAAAAGAGEGAEALRSAGVEVELRGYTVEVVFDPADPRPATSIRVEFRRSD